MRIVRYGPVLGCRAVSRQTTAPSAVPLGLPVRVRTKICGITSVRDAGVAVAAGCDAVGMVFHRDSPRAVDVEQAAAIAAATPPFVARVGVFVDASRAEVEAVLARVDLDALQFHGAEPAADCEGFGVPYIKAFRVRKALDMAALEEGYPSAGAFLLDAFHPVERGGAGVAFDWSLWPERCGKPLVLAGGLTPDNVGDAIRGLRPYAVDVSSGVEDGVKGVKSAAKVRAFLTEAHRAGAQ